MRGRFLSVVVPVYRAETFIKKNLQAFLKSVNRLKPEVVDQVEVVAVIDGEVDKSRLEAEKVKGVRVVSYKENRGKGHALLTGVKHAKGNIITFLDADGDFHPDQVANLFPYLATADIVVGSKRHPFSRVDYPLSRRVLSRGYQLLSNIILGTSLRDTQSGLKLMKREVLEVILPSITIKRFGFDIELCFLAQMHGFRTVEAPVSLDFKGTSTVGPRVPFRMGLDLLAIRWRYSYKKYYQQQYHKAWFNFKNPS